ncbi:ribosomal protein S19E (S16A) [Pseudomonas corrugata]|nr:ribosomal protein S19E (S16A) [Pseudomonas corrugata]
MFKNTLHSVKGQRRLATPTWFIEQTVQSLSLETLAPTGDNREREPGQPSNFYSRAALGRQQNHSRPTTVALADSGGTDASAQLGVFFWTEDDF